LLSKEFTEEQKEILKKKLKDIEAELEERAVKSPDNIFWKAKFDDFGIEDDDEVLEDEVFDVKVAQIKNLLEDKAQIELALEKFYNGSYGICANCRQEIDVERLKAFPEATFCIKCDS